MGRIGHKGALPIELCRHARKERVLGVHQRTQFGGCAGQRQGGGILRRAAGQALRQFPERGGLPSQQPEEPQQADGQKGQPGERLPPEQGKGHVPPVGEVLPHHHDPFPVRRAEPDFAPDGPLFACRAVDEAPPQRCGRQTFARPAVAQQAVPVPVVDGEGKRLFVLAAADFFAAVGQDIARRGQNGGSFRRRGRGFRAGWGGNVLRLRVGRRRRARLIMYGKKRPGIEELLGVEKGIQIPAVDGKGDQQHHGPDDQEEQAEQQAEAQAQAAVPQGKALHASSPSI